MPQLLKAIELSHNRPVIAVLALATHYVLHKGEWDNAFHLFLAIWAVSFGGIAASEYLYGQQAGNTSAAIQVTAIAAVVYFGTLSISILLHRGFFHRLRRVSRSDRYRECTVANLIARYLDRSSHVSPNFTASSREFSPTISISSGPRNYKQNTKPMSFELAHERLPCFRLMLFLSSMGLCQGAGKAHGMLALRILEVLRLRLHAIRKNTSADAKLGTTPSMRRHCGITNLA